MPITRSGRDTSSPQKPEITIHNIKKEPVTPPRFPFSETPPWMNSQLPQLNQNSQINKHAKILLEKVLAEDPIILYAQLTKYLLVTVQA